ncbi:ABC transporter ATP-binding protein [Desulfonema ishimotonii]|uniref:ABC transporter ATP-binding protein n=1 Tax=Desulfonema ishimotonii TaxID=45657 RepID=A0A401G358_9BACT|nr:ABC transporter ATP-binding protein [Desulfonema ishimotonii]GBC63611.1 ABC transporter ATP-binding protein [Desulfonema ishimotonii]
MKLSVAGITFAYNSHPVIRDVSFSLEPGQVLGVLGVNGAGKSTLLKCLNKILHPSGGAVFLGGKDLLKMDGAEIARHMAYVPQKYGGEQLTVFDTVLLGRKPHIRWAATHRDYEVVETVLERMGLARFALRPVLALSGGEMQKVVMARALAQEPDVLLLDEPTSNLDLKNQFEVMGLVRQVVREQKLAAVVSIHDLNLALRFADRFLMVRDHTVFSLTDRESVTREMIRDVYGVEVLLTEVEGHRVVVPL